MATSAVSTTDRFYFSKEQLENTPSRKNGVEPEKEQSYRQQAATLIQDMGQRLSVNQLTINTAIVYMHRFYMFHSFNKFHRNALAPCCLFLAAKTEEQPRKLEHVLKVAHACLHRDGPQLDPKSEEYLQQAQDLIENESILLQTLGFEITVHHPHTYVVKCIQLVRASKDLGQTSYFMATNSLHLTTLCLQYKPPVVACACIHLASKWSNWEIPQSNDGKDWWEYIDPSVNKSMLDDIAQDFLKVMEKCPNRLKRKINTVTNLKGVSHSKMSKGESTSSRASSSSAASASSTSHGLVDGAQNGYSFYDVPFSNELDGKALHRSKSDKDREREKEKRRESSLGKLKPLPVATSTVTASSTTGASSSNSNTVLPPLPPLPPLTSKYASLPSANLVQSNDVKGSSAASSSAKDSSSSRGKHRHHPHDESQPAKKHKSSHSHAQRSHSSSSSSSHRKPSGSSQSSDSSPSPSLKHGHSSAHKSSSHSAKLSNPSHHHSQTGLSSQPAHGSSHSSKKPHPTPHPPSHKSSSSSSSSQHHGHHGHSSSHRPPTASLESSKKHSSAVRSGAAVSSQPAPTARQLTPPPPPPPPPSTMDLGLLSSLNTPGMLGVFPSAEMQAMQPPISMQFGGHFMPPMFSSNSRPSMLQGEAPPPPPPEPEPAAPPPPPPPMP
ncbi:cyclin-T1-like [Acropora muricata]|uniref:cyclin-T1-like n=1 Tax=Acropora muricata TaxID=159855 RepID=UPI0034E5D7C0